jgi:hypothetical protein
VSLPIREDQLNKFHICIFEVVMGIRRSTSQALRLQDAAGHCIDRLTRVEAKSLLEQGKVRRINPYTYRLITPASPSNSEESPATLTTADVMTLIGAKRMTQARRERLVGWGLLQN